MPRKEDQEFSETETPPAAAAAAGGAQSAVQFPEEYYVDPMGMKRYVVQEKTLFSWLAPSKLERSRTSSEVTQVVLFCVLVELIVFLMGEWWLAIVFAAAMAVFLIFLFTKPTYLKCQVTTIGLKIEDKYYYWPQFTQFWFETKAGVRLLFLRNLFPVEQNLKLIIQEADEEEVKKKIGTYLLYKKPSQNYWEKLWQNILTRLPIDLDVW